MNYRVMFHDTMAYGSHHHVTNIKLQNIIRETLLFSTRHNNEGYEEQLSDAVALTREAHSFNLAPVNLAEKVAILMTLEEPTRSTVRLCFRIIHENGQPVSCGYQTMVLLNPKNLEPLPIPPFLVKYFDAASPTCLVEASNKLSFKDKVLGGSKYLKEAFNDEIIGIGQHIAQAPNHLSFPKFINNDFQEFDLDGSPYINTSRTGLSDVTKTVVSSFSGKRAIVMPGQGSFDTNILKYLYESSSLNEKSLFDHAETLAQQYFNKSFMKVILAQPLNSPTQLTTEYENFPDSDQIGIFLCNYLIGKHWLDHLDNENKPDVLIGHSFGEYAALALAEVITPQQGLEITCQRIRSLHLKPVMGNMAAVSCDEASLKNHLVDAGLASLEISVVNHAKQCVVSGIKSELIQLQNALLQYGISLTFLKSRYPFHSSHLVDSVPLFQKDLVKYNFLSPRISVYLGTENKLLDRNDNLPKILSNQFTRKLDFSKVSQFLTEVGIEEILEAGAGSIVTSLLKREIKNPNVSFVSPASTLEGFKDFLRTDDPEVDRKTKFDALDESSLPNADPIAIVSMGCYLPNAKNTDIYWNNLVNGISGIVDLAKTDSQTAQDFLYSEANEDLVIKPDKTYTMLNGAIQDIEYDDSLFGEYYKKEEFQKLTKGQRLFVHALTQAIRGLKNAKEIDPNKIECIIGATADGSKEYDYALFADSLYSIGEKSGLDTKGLNEFDDVVRATLGYGKEDEPALEQSKIYRNILNHIIPDANDIYVVDTACSSSLYAIYLGIQSLRSGDKDIIIAGGVFAPGPANNTLFAQFRGLTPNGSRPFDEAADGVVFGDGAAVVVLKRLDDALNQGDEILGVIRGIGLSSDGKSPSINVPQKAGQSLALERAYSNAGIDVNTVQYVEAHATATPVGDAVEFESLTQMFNGVKPASVELGSVKSLTGHTGWVSGVASIIKHILALQHKVLPAQYNYDRPNTKIALEGSAFKISKNNKDWPENSNNLPRRIGINGFGFGGTNAHLVLEEFKSEYHIPLAKHVPFETNDLAILGWVALLPDKEGFVSEYSQENIFQFNRKKYQLPKKKRLLPDVTDQMDISQFLTTLAAEKLFEKWEGWEEVKEEVAIVLALQSKTDLGQHANERIFLDRLERLIKENNDLSDNNKIKQLKHFEWLKHAIQEKISPSGAYTLPGLMPNVSASRISNMFDLKGPNLVIDRGEYSLLQALQSATALLEAGDCHTVLVGGVNAASTYRKESEGEAVFLAAITTYENAKQKGWHIERVLPKNMLKAIPKFGRDESERYYRGVQGFDLLQAWLSMPDESSDSIEIKPEDEATKVRSSSSVVSDVPEKKSRPNAFLQNTPIAYYHAVEVLQKTQPQLRLSLENKKLLLVVDQKDWWDSIRNSGVLDAYDCTVICPQKVNIEEAFLVDLGSEISAQKTLATLSNKHFDFIIGLKNLGDEENKESPNHFLSGELYQSTQFIDLMFSVAKAFYGVLSASDAQQKTHLMTCCLGAYQKGNLKPYTGLVAGFMKSIARELKDADCRMVNTSSVGLLDTFNEIEIELGYSPYLGEVCFHGKERYQVQLKNHETPTNDTEAYIDENSVILVTGGGRGITAVLVEELLTRYGCTVIAIGRTDLVNIPSKVLAMTEAEFKDYESEFYREGLALKTEGGIKALKALYQKYQAGNELQHVVKKMSGLQGEYIYTSLDINNESAVTDLVKSIKTTHGKMSIVIHGAGVQYSTAVPKKSLDEFRFVINTKLGSLGYLYRAVNQSFPTAKIHYHILTSAFSYMGNDGQPDYGAANEAMNRLAESMNNAGLNGYWSTIAWLGWAGIGMTRGSEYKALATSRGLRGVTRDEGKKLFNQLMAGRPAHPANIVLAQGEIDYYELALDGESHSKKGVNALGSDLRLELNAVKEETKEIEVSLDSDPFIQDHIVSGIPTLPAAFVIRLIAEAVQEFRPLLKVAEFLDTEFIRFIRVFPGKISEFRISMKVLQETQDSAHLQVQVFSDFIHKSGRILQKDILHNVTLVLMQLDIPEAKQLLSFNVEGEKDRRDGGTGGTELPDPYMLGAGGVELKGQFDSMGKTKIGAVQRKADYQLAKSPYSDEKNSLRVPNTILLDALWRFGTIFLNSQNQLSVYVPRKCRSMKFYYNFADDNSTFLMDGLILGGNHPIENADNNLHVGPIYVTDRKGRLLLEVDGGECDYFDSIEYTF